MQFEEEKKEQAPGVLIQQPMFEYKSSDDKPKLGGGKMIDAPKVFDQAPPMVIPRNSMKLKATI